MEVLRNNPRKNRQNLNRASVVHSVVAFGILDFERFYFQNWNTASQFFVTFFLTKKVNENCFY